MAGKSKAKGSAHERAVADTLTTWYGKQFKRVPNSGALRWGAESTWHYGDLLPPQGFNVCVEAKHYAHICFDEILGRPRKPRPGQPSIPPSFGDGHVATWWYEQTIPDAARATEELGTPVDCLLVWKQDFHRSRVCLREPLYSAIAAEIRKKLVCCWMYVPEKPPFMMLDFENFLTNVSGSEFDKAFRKLHSIA
jgi:hypothetical protein